MTTLAAPRPAPTPGSPATPRADPKGAKSGFYRYDLDGLRGIAIALVAVFHVWFGRVSGGVDVFLALSGFFFGGKLLRTALNPQSSLSPLPELRRLARRLLPALVVVLAGVAVLTVAIQPETRWETFADQSLASLGYFQNWELAATASNYLRAGEAVSPLQHIWSMSVQGQFYVTFLALVFGFAALFRRRLGDRLRMWFIVLLSVLTVASFSYAIQLHDTDQVNAYYNSFARGWELLLGALVGALVPMVRWPMWLRNVVAAVSLAVIVSCGAVIDGVREFPGPLALVPVGATMLFILSAANHTDKLPAPNRLLATRPFRQLGDISYSLYLWHWPLLIFWLAYTGDTKANFLDGSAVLLVSGVLAWFTTHYVETPLRYAATAPAAAPPRPAVTRPALWSRLRRPTMVLGSVVTILGVVLTATSFTWREHITSERAKGKELLTLSALDYPGARALLNPHLKVPKLPFRPTVLEARDDIPMTTTDGCIADFDDLSIRNCVYGDKNARRTIALAGGSHAEHWITALDLLGKMHHFRVVTYMKMGCPLSTETNPLVMGDNRPYPKCYEWNELVMPKLIASHPDYVFTTSTRPWNIKPGDVMPGTYIGIWQQLTNAGIPILAMRDTPWLVRDDKPFFPADCLASGGNAVSCGIKRSEVLSDHNPTEDFVAQFPLLRTLDMSNAVCRPDICRAVEGNVLLYHDSHHLSATYMRTMTGELGRQMADRTGWW